MAKILYGVQATGNGHITRARALVPWLRQVGFDVDVLLSGREREKLFGLEDFGHYRTRRGFTFALDDGRVNFFRTFIEAEIARFWRDVKALNLDAYDFILTDFEPVTAWAARRAGRVCIGVGHQYAFNFPVPKDGLQLPARAVMRWFAPASVSLGLHWDSFNSPILPPIIEPGDGHRAVQPGRYLVYLPFDSTARVMQLLRRFPDVKFTFYSDVQAPYSEQHIQVKPYSRTGFREDLAIAEGVICGAGFELPSEALSLGKKLLVQPLEGQFEQCSNAKALKLLDRAAVMHHLNPAPVQAFLDSPAPAPQHYPNVARAIALWLKDGRRESVGALSERLWNATEANKPDLVPGLRRGLFESESY